MDPAEGDPGPAELSSSIGSMPSTVSSAPLVKPTLSTAWIATTNSRGSSAELADSTAREASAIARAASAGSLRIARVDSHTDSDRGDPVAMLDLLLGGPGAPVGVSALGFVLIRAAVVANRRYLVGVQLFVFQWLGFCLLGFGYVFLVWFFTAVWTWTDIDAGPALAQYVVVVVAYPLIAPLLARALRDPLNVPEASRGTAQPGETTS